MTDQQKVVMSMMHKAGKVGVFNYEFAQNYILRYSARIDELREIGVKIKTIRVKTGVFKYILEQYLVEEPKKESWQSAKKRNERELLESKMERLL